MVPDLRGHEVELEVGVRHVRAAADEAACLDVARAGGPGSVQEPLDPRPQHPEPLLLLVEADGLGAGAHEVDIQVVLEVLAHARQVVDRLDSHLAEVFSVANTRQHQQLGCVDGASTQDDLV